MSVYMSTDAAKKAATSGFALRPQAQGIAAFNTSLETCKQLEEQMHPMLESINELQLCSSAETVYPTPQKNMLESQEWRTLITITAPACESPFSYLTLSFDPQFVFIFFYIHAIVPPYLGGCIPTLPVDA